MSDTEESTGGDSRDEFEEALYWLGRELREARQALWHGKTGKAFASIEAAQDQLDNLGEEIDHD
jgi:hypothetical protein